MSKLYKIVKTIQNIKDRAATIATDASFYNVSNNKPLGKYNYFLLVCTYQITLLGDYNKDIKTVSVEIGWVTDHIIYRRCARVYTYSNNNAHQHYIVDTSCTKLKYVSGKQTCNDIEKKDKILVDSAVNKYIEGIPGLTKSPFIDNDTLLLEACVYKYQDEYDHYNNNGDIYSVKGEYLDTNQHDQTTYYDTMAKKYSWKLTNYHKELCHNTVKKYGLTEISRTVPPKFFDGSDATEKLNKIKEVIAARQELYKEAKAAETAAAAAAAETAAAAKTAAMAAKQTAANNAKISECKAFLIEKKYTVSDAPIGGRRRKTIKRSGGRNTRGRRKTRG